MKQGIKKDAMSRAFADEDASAFLKMTNEINPFHAA